MNACKPFGICEKCLNENLVVCRGVLVCFCHHNATGAIRAEDSNETWWHCLSPITEKHFAEILNTAEAEFQELRELFR